jgi:hypothetical protein
MKFIFGLGYSRAYFWVAICGIPKAPFGILVLVPPHHLRSALKIKRLGPYPKSFEYRRLQQPRQLPFRLAHRQQALR